MMKTERPLTDSCGSTKISPSAKCSTLILPKGNPKCLQIDAIENKDEIDVERAIAAKIRAEQRLQSNDKNVDQVRAEIALKKALNRLNVKG